MITIIVVRRSEWLKRYISFLIIKIEKACVNTAFLV
jgi:hypothetical protein